MHHRMPAVADPLRRLRGGQVCHSNMPPRLRRRFFSSRSAIASASARAQSVQKTPRRPPPPPRQTPPCMRRTCSPNLHLRSGQGPAPARRWSSPACPSWVSLCSICISPEVVIQIGVQSMEPHAVKAAPEGHAPRQLPDMVREYPSMLIGSPASLAARLSNSTICNENAGSSRRHHQCQQGDAEHGVERGAQLAPGGAAQRLRRRRAGGKAQQARNEAGAPSIANTESRSNGCVHEGEKPPQRRAGSDSLKR